MNRNRQAVMMFGFGALCGAAAALLLAPESGRQTRERVRAWGEAAGRRARHGAEAVKNLAVEQKERLERAIEEGRAAYEREESAMPRERTTARS